MIGNEDDGLPDTSLHLGKLLHRGKAQANLSSGFAFGNCHFFRIFLDATFFVFL